MTARNPGITIPCRRCWVALASLAALAASAPARPATADPEPQSPSSFRQFVERDYLSGDWGGGRSWLAQRGVEFEFLYAGSVPTCVSGGFNQGSVYESALLMLMDVDSAKLAGYPDGHFHVSSLALDSGRAFSQNFVGDLNQVSLLDFPDMFRLWELWYEQKFFNQKVALKVGELDIGTDFITPEFYNTIGSVTFLNQTFFFPTMAFNVFDRPAPIFPVEHHGLASTPYAAPGVRLRVDPIPEIYAQAGVYGGNPDRSHSGTEFHLSETEGALAYFELGFRLNRGKDAAGPPGSYKVGGYYHTGDFVDNYDSITGYAGFPGAGVQPAHEGNYGVYGLADQVLWREGGKEDKARQGLTGFVLAAAAPSDRNLAQFGVNGGLVYRGLIPGRDWDTLGLAGSYLEMSGDIRRAQENLNAVFGPGTVPLADHESVLELNYKAQLTAWWTLQTSVQRVWHPGGRLSTETPDAWVVIVQTAFRL